MRRSATLIAARVQVEANELDKAAASLKSVMDTATDEELKMVARMRLARVQSAQGKYDDALATLKVDDTGEFAPRFADTRGDVLLAKGDRAGALREYLAARTGENKGRVDTELLDLKIRDLGGTPPASAGRILMNPMKKRSLVGSGGAARARGVRFEGQESRKARRAHRHQEPDGARAEALGRECRRRRQEAAPGAGPRHGRQPLFAAGRDGDVAAFDLKTGKQLWRVGNQARAGRWHRRRRRHRRRGFGRWPGGRARGRQRRASAGAPK